MEFYDVNISRRSIRQYRSDEVSREKLIRILEAARQAPSWKNKQCWQYIIISDPATRQALSETLKKGNPATKGFIQAPLVVAICAKPEQSGNVNGRDFYMFDAGLAFQNLVLAAAEEGLGTCIVGLFDEDLARNILDVPEDYKVVAFTPLGYPAEEPSSRPRKSLDDIVYWEKWGERP